MNSKIEKELDKLLEAKVISRSVQEDIKAYYAKDTVEKPNKLFAIFGVLGSLLTGLGIILILAHNWDDFSRATKTFWAFVPLVVGQLFAAYTLFKKRSSAWKETAAVFLFFAIGASMALVSQIYNIPGEMSSFLLTWIVLAAPLVYLLKSHAVALLHLLFATIYACNVGCFNDTTPYLYLLLLGWLLPYYWMQLKSKPSSNITGIFNWFLPLSLLITLGAFVQWDDSFVFLTYIFLFGLFYNLGKLPFFEHQKMRANGYLLLGSLGTVFTLFITSFSFVWDEFINDFLSINDTAVTIVIGLVTLAVIAFMYSKKRLRPFNLFQYVFVLFFGICLFKEGGSFVPTILVNILILALGVFAVEMGARKNLFSVLNYGLLIITGLITCRFFDTDISFVLRGLLFVAIGAGFFGANYFMYKKQQKQQKLTINE
ncbi:hypothetical protein SCB49_08508 [unidentified eubacterium SCB49]|nr:hypothetical protein SCB49_08508 [unidentified eubacterium SCB49]